jgi:predicted DNA-binding transcriptional regulator AlpA
VSAPPIDNPDNPHVHSPDRDEPSQWEVSFMVKIGDELRQAEIITLAEACRRVGISIPTALKLMPKEFPEAFWLGGKRVIARRRLDAWVAEKVGIVD